MSGEKLTKQDRVSSMVSTRRSTANALPTHAAIKNPQSTKSSSETIHVCKPHNLQLSEMPMTPKIPSTPIGKEPSGNTSEPDLSLACPFTDDVSEEIIVSARRNQNKSPDTARGTVPYTPPRLVPKSLASMSGSCQDPIIVEETVSPPRLTARAPKQKLRHGHERRPEPHLFMGKGYRELYNYGVARLDIAAMPATGSTFTGHQSHDIYRMMHAKTKAPPNFSLSAVPGRNTLTAPFESQYPRTAPVLTQQHGQHHEYPTPVFCYPVAPSQNEYIIRDRAAQYIQEYSGASAHKRRHSDFGYDEIGNPEAGQPTVNNQPPWSRQPPHQTIVPLFKPQFGLIHQNIHCGVNTHHLIEHASILTSLLQIYPNSSNQRGLREDISMLVSLQNQHIAQWIKAESQHSPKRRKSNTDTAALVANRTTQPTGLGTRAENEEDKALRRVFSANADMWQDGTGHGVADVFAAAPPPSPVVRLTQHCQSTHGLATEATVKAPASQPWISLMTSNNAAPTIPKRIRTAKRRNTSSTSPSRGK